MAEKKYTALFEAKDRVSPEVEKMRKAMVRARDEKGRFIKKVAELDKQQKEYVTTTKRTTDSVERMKRALSGVGSGFATMGTRGMTAVRTLGGGLKGIVSTLTSLPALIAGAGAAFGALKLGEAIVGGAMQKELTQLQMGALLADQNKGQDLFKIVQSKAMTSMFSEQEFSKAATTFLPVTKDFGDIERLMSVNERLASSNLMEGMEGASFSLREALSGDIASIAERFNISKSGLRENGFDSAGSWQQNLNAVDKTLDKMGYTAAYVDEVNDSAYAQWQLFKSNALKLFADSGEGILSKLKEPLKELNTVMGSSRMSAFVDKFGDFLAGKLSAGVQFVDDMNLKWGDFERVLSDAGDIFSGVGDSFAIMMGTFDGEKGKSPRDAFEQFAESIEAGGKAVHDFNDSFGPFIDGIRSVVEWSKGPSKGDGEGGKSKGAIMWARDALTGRGTDWHYKSDENSGFNRQLGPLFDIFDMLNFNPNAGSSGRLRGSHRAGLSYVPYDGYVAELHKGEEVVPAQAAGRNNGQVLVTGNTFHVRQESDIDAIGRALANELRLKGAI